MRGGQPRRRPACPHHEPSLPHPDDPGAASLRWRPLGRGMYPRRWASPAQPLPPLLCPLLCPPRHCRRVVPCSGSKMLPVRSMGTPGTRGRSSRLACRPRHRRAAFLCLGAPARYSRRLCCRPRNLPALPLLWLHPLGDRGRAFPGGRTFPAGTCHGCPALVRHARCPGGRQASWEVPVGAVPAQSGAPAAGGPPPPAAGPLLPRPADAWLCGARPALIAAAPWRCACLRRQAMRGADVVGRWHCDRACWAHAPEV